MVVIPKGVEHKPSCKEEYKILLIGPAGTLNTGDAGGDLTVTDLEWIWILLKQLLTSGCTRTARKLAAGEPHLYILYQSE